MSEWYRQVFIAETGIDPVADGDEEVRHCEWRPITDEQRSGEPIFIWHDEELDMAWWMGDGFYCEAVFGCYRVNPQPKYHLAAVPPPEE